MKTYPIKYIGVKPEHVDTLYGTGLIWRRGETHKVERETAQFMLMHPDVYEDARPAMARKKDPLTPAKPPIARRDVDGELPLANLAHMTKADMARYNAVNFGEHLDPEKMTVPQMRSHIVSRMRERA